MNQRRKEKLRDLMAAADEVNAPLPMKRVLVLNHPPNLCAAADRAAARIKAEGGSAWLCEWRGFREVHAVGTCPESTAWGNAIIEDTRQPIVTTTLPQPVALPSVNSSTLF